MVYDPTIGRFLTEDPLKFEAGDANLYRYVGNAPTFAVDPTGLVGDFLEYHGFNFAVTKTYRFREPIGHQIVHGQVQWIMAERPRIVTKTLMGAEVGYTLAEPGAGEAVAYPSQEHPGKCRVAFAVSGFAAVQIRPEQDVHNYLIWERMTRFEYTPANSFSVPQKVSYVFYHEMDHLNTFLDAYSSIISALAQLEAMEFDGMAAAQRVIAGVKAELKRVWDAQKTHSAMFDTDPWWSGAMYGDLPLPNSAKFGLQNVLSSVEGR